MPNASGPLRHGDDPPVELDSDTVRMLELSDTLTSPIAIRLPSLGRGDLAAMGQWLTDSVELLKARPFRNPSLCFELDDQVFLSERGFWTLAAQLCDSPLTLIGDYVRQVLAAWEYSLEEAHHRVASVAGEEALYALMDVRIMRFAEFRFVASLDELGEFCDVLTDFMACCDHDHGVRQARRMDALLDVLVSNHLLQGEQSESWRERYARLASIFEYYGPWDSRDSSSASSRYRASQTGVFKMMLKHLAGRDHPPEYLPLISNRSERAATEYRGTTEFALCGLIESLYGTDPAREEVFAWVESRTGVDIRDSSGSDQERLKLIDAALAGSEISCVDNGFHRFDSDERRWVARTQSTQESTAG